MFTEILDFVNTRGAELVVDVLAILGAFSIVAKWTPTKVDDAWIQKAIDFIHALGLTKKQ